MKYFVIVIIALVALAGIFTFQKSKTILKQTIHQQISPTVLIPPSDSEVTIQDHVFSIYWQLIDAEDLTLIPNFTEKKTASQIIEKNDCKYGANGGFYTTDYKPIGLFRTQSGQLSKATSNATLNGFFSKNSRGVLTLSRNASSDEINFALQSGPYMTPSSQLSIKNDSYNRRILVAQTNSNAWYFLAITEKDNSFSGPKLSDVPIILEKLPLGIIEALNLDGGSASAFYSGKGVRLGELTSIGSFFCGKKL